MILLDPALRFHQNLGDSLADPSRYRRLIGRLIYLIVTEPDITFVSVLSQYMQTHHQLHWDAAYCVTVSKDAPGEGLFLPAFSS